MLPTISLSLLNDTVSEEGPGLVYLFKRTGDLSKGLRVAFTVAGTAKNTADYALSWPTAVFAPGSADATITVRPTKDAEVEPTETVAIKILPLTFRYNIGTQEAVVGRILDGAIVEGTDFNEGQPGLNWNIPA